MTLLRRDNPGRVQQHRVATGQQESRQHTQPANKLED
jgi:hypothetical protein